MFDLEEKTIKKFDVYNGIIFDVERHEVLLPDGNISKRDVLKHNGGVAILAITDKNEILLVEQYRKAIDTITLELPAGKLAKNENPIKCAVRELKEETGYSVTENDLELVCKTHSAIGYSSELLIIYYVNNLSENNLSNLDLDDEEFLHLKKYEIAKAFELLDNNVITDGKTIIALQWLRNKRLNFDVSL